jgi:hypothetical protein
MAGRDEVALRETDLLLLDRALDSAVKSKNVLASTEDFRASSGSSSLHSYEYLTRIPADVEVDIFRLWA